MTVKGLRSILILCALQQGILIVIRNILSVSASLWKHRVKNVSFTWKREASLSKHQPESRATENRLWLGWVVTLTLPCRSANQEPWWGLLDSASGTWPSGRWQSHWLILFHLGSCHRLIGPVSTKKMPQSFTPFSGLMLHKPKPSCR